MVGFVCLVQCLDHPVPGLHVAVERRVLAPGRLQDDPALESPVLLGRRTVEEVRHGDPRRVIRLIEFGEGKDSLDSQRPRRRRSLLGGRNMEVVDTDLTLAGSDTKEADEGLASGGLAGPVRANERRESVLQPNLCALTEALEILEGQRFHKHVVRDSDQGQLMTRSR